MIRPGGFGRGRMALMRPLPNLFRLEGGRRSLSQAFCREDGHAKMGMPNGRLKFFNTDRGYGFIAPDGTMAAAPMFSCMSTTVEAAGMNILVAGQVAAYEVGPAREAAQRPTRMALSHQGRRRPSNLLVSGRADEAA